MISLTSRLRRARKLLPLVLVCILGFSLTPLASASAAPNSPSAVTTAIVTTPSIGGVSAKKYGVPKGTKLKKVTGDMTIRKAGTVINGIDLHGRIVVKAPNVVIKNSIIRGNKTSSSLVKSQSKNLQIRDTELVAKYPTPNVNGVIGSNFTLLRVNIHKVVDPVRISGSGNVTVKNSWLHGNLHYKKDPNWRGKPSHDDSIQIESGKNITITGNKLEGAHNAAIMVAQNGGKISNVKIENNTISGGACSINFSEKGKGSLQKMYVRKNVFKKNQTISGCAVIRPTSSKITISGNTWSNGKAVAAKKG